MNFEYLNQMIKYIEDNLTENIEYKELSKIVGVSEYNLQRIFNFLTNISLAEYIRKRRLKEAASELITTDNKIVDIALKYQFSSQEAFTKAFKRIYGVPPREFRTSKVMVFDRRSSNVTKLSMAA